MTPALLERTNRQIIEPTLEGMRLEGNSYQGVLFVGLMITSEGPKVIEYNCRLGDPETQAVLPVYGGDLLELLMNAADGKLTASQPATKGYAAVVVLASGGYPGDYQSGFPIQGMDEANATKNLHVVHAGTKTKDAVLQTAGGRVLGVVGEAPSLAQALHAAYEGVGHIRFEGMQYRRDIGQRGLKAIG